MNKTITAHVLVCTGGDTQGRWKVHYIPISPQVHPQNHRAWAEKQALAGVYERVFYSKVLRIVTEGDAHTPLPLRSLLGDNYRTDSYKLCAVIAGELAREYAHIVADHATVKKIHGFLYDKAGATALGELLPHIEIILHKQTRIEEELEQSGHTIPQYADPMYRFNA